MHRYNLQQQQQQQQQQQCCMCAGVSLMLK